MTKPKNDMTKPTDKMAKPKYNMPTKDKIFIIHLFSDNFLLIKRFSENFNHSAKKV